MLENLDDATMNQLLKNLIAKLLRQRFSRAMARGRTRQKELSKKRTSTQEPKARRTENSLKGFKG